MSDLHYTYIMRDQVRDQVKALMKTDARGRRRYRHWSGLPRVVASVVGIRRR
jgi:hypothetical protein